MRTCVHAYLACKRHAHKSTPPISIFTHCKCPVYWASTQYGENEGLWLSAHGRLPGTLQYNIYTCTHTCIHLIGFHLYIFLNITENSYRTKLNMLAIGLVPE